jgi:6-phosphogluconolactonase/glucosamine-6-phosphate isomerase/deaminase
MNIFTYETAPQAQQAAVQRLTRALAAAHQDAEPVLLLLSGGSNLAIAAAVDTQLYKNVTILPLDERYSTDPSTNNSLQMQALGLPVQLVVPEPSETVAALGIRFEQLLKDWRQQHPQGKIIITLGMGTDGHIAGISPLPDNPNRFDQLFVTTHQWAVGYEGLLLPPERVTVTMPFLLTQVDQGIGYITGAEKLFKLTQASLPQQLLHQLPMVGIIDAPWLTLFTSTN